MTDTEKQEGQDETSLKKVKRFGNSGHVTLPKEFIGETVKVTLANNSGNQPYRISPPITTDKIDSVLSNSTRSDFKRIQRDADRFPRECRFQYRHDVRLTIDVDLEYESSEHPHTELGTVVYFFSEITEEELDKHADWFDKDEDELSVELVFGLDPSVDDLFNHPTVTYNDLYKYDVNWDGSSVYSVKLSNRQAKNGRFYYPSFSNYESLADYQDSTAYRLATAISEAPEKEYDRYLNALQLEETIWGEKDMPLSFDREEELERTVLYGPQD
ncbi:DUF2080 family transposase-associated protein [Haloarcula sp. Atlit-7R]|uniref:DUF2080 family transposase-associated protein n=1 Tax=Haloarcula sp. Atlit-7R TaxID=2282125 RepID=UPI000EF13C88|nr:DUF2080 family transposase-associated protein [Haloarcula sp. Atlit-7R]RLM94381.1 DUF2080 family transposase-associated protein [Haloarcula sp. Atlit-7R]